MRVKICGINDVAGRDAALAAGADWLGFVFFPASPRAVTPTQAAALAAGVPARVGLFVKPTDDDIATTLAALRLDVLQIYADAERATAIRARFGCPVWRAVGVAAPSDLPRSADGVDGFVIEAKPPQDASRPGGNATTFDWSILAGWQAPLPWMLAGGLTPENVAEAIRNTGAPAVDVSSGVERAKGVKDPERIRAFVASARAGRK
ncbi:phosphoribosylanthranilate isomerase [Rhodovastum atsumiense]|uniref:N-(5'-phosphoribosyl)anthranilate isomerase n=1 Tax=Rhodovastum atsumiense TaxID=504468 RepID=A0A5M6ISQ1_9PROT|nr:phosphoribosylanthranilate isomerase [Rhodovastum atsumiense]KAA5610475.1 phosphoribosylanthranilate isomerase [Rhodovastum atsumiense]